MRKILALCLVIVMVATLLVACGNKPTETTYYDLVTVSKDGDYYTFTYIDGEEEVTVRNFKDNGNKKRVEMGGMNMFAYYPDGDKYILFLSKDILDKLNAGDVYKK